jgi:DNA-binding MarR family transcriptional regulator
MDKMIFYMRQCEKFIRLAAKINEGMHRPHHFGTKELLYTSEIHIVDLIGRNPKINVSEVAERLGVQKSAIPKVIRKLVDKDLVVRSVPPQNRKMVQLELTELGWVAYRAHITYHETINRDLIDHFNHCSQEEMIFLDRILSEIEQGIDDILKQPEEK